MAALVHVETAKICKTFVTLILLHVLLETLLNWYFMLKVLKFVFCREPEIDFSKVIVKSKTFDTVDNYTVRQFWMFWWDMKFKNVERAW